jgi:hypothetical protein
VHRDVEPGEGKMGAHLRRVFFGAASGGVVEVAEREKVDTVDAGFCSASAQGVMAKGGNEN